MNGDVGVNTSAPQVTGNALVNGSVSFNNTGPQFQANLFRVRNSGAGHQLLRQGNHHPEHPRDPADGDAVPHRHVEFVGLDGMDGRCLQRRLWKHAELEFDTDRRIRGVGQRYRLRHSHGSLHEFCAIALPQNLVEQLSANLAIVDTATGGMTFNADTFESKTSQVHNVDLIVPSDPASPGTATLMSQATCGSNYQIQGLN